MDQFSGKSGQIRLFSDDDFDLVRLETKEGIEACACETAWAARTEPHLIAGHEKQGFIVQTQGSLNFIAMRSEGITDPYYIALTEKEREHGKLNNYVLTTDQAIETLRFYQRMAGFVREVDNLAKHVLEPHEHANITTPGQRLFDIQLDGGLKFVAGHIDKNDRKAVLDALKGDQELHQKMVKAVNQAGNRQNGKGWQPELVT